MYEYKLIAKNANNYCFNDIFYLQQTMFNVLIYILNENVY